MSSEDNISFALVSLKKLLVTYLNNQGWTNDYSIFLAGDKSLLTKEIVEGTPDRNQIQMPVIIIDTGWVTNDPEELGSDSGKDVVTISIQVIAKDETQLRTLANVIRRYMHNTQYSVCDHRDGLDTVLDTAYTNDAMIIDISDVNSTALKARYVSVVEFEIVIDADNYT